MPIRSTFYLKKILTSYSHKTKLNLINVQMQPERDTTTFILPWCVEVQ